MNSVLNREVFASKVRLFLPAWKIGSKFWGGLCLFCFLSSSSLCSSSLREFVTVCESRFIPPPRSKPCVSSAKEQRIGALSSIEWTLTLVFISNYTNRDRMAAIIASAVNRGGRARFSFFAFSNFAKVSCSDPNPPLPIFPTARDLLQYNWR